MVTKDTSEEQKLDASMRWLFDNYGHIIFHHELSVNEKAGFLAACCDGRRCYLATLSLSHRITEIERVLTQVLG